MRGAAGKAVTGWLGHVGDHPLYPVLHSLATLGPVGYIPGAPGTAASLVALVVWLAVAPHSPAWAPLLLFPMGALGVACAGDVARFEERADPSEVVIDEAIGMWLTLALAPAGVLAASAGFLAFRTFDVAKPFPVRWLERIPGGWGIVADDLGAALYAGAAVRLVWSLLGLG